MRVFWLKSMRSQDSSEKRRYFRASILTGLGDNIPGCTVMCLLLRQIEGKLSSSEVQFKWPLRLVKCSCPMVLLLHYILYVLLQFHSEKIVCRPVLWALTASMILPHLNFHSKPTLGISGHFILRCEHMTWTKFNKCLSLASIISCATE